MKCKNKKVQIVIPQYFQTVHKRTLKMSEGVTKNNGKGYGMGSADCVHRSAHELPNKGPESFHGRAAHPTG